jgi:hypothetical protein
MAGETAAKKALKKNSGSPAKTAIARTAKKSAKRLKVVATKKVVVIAKTQSLKRTKGPARSN